MINGGKVEGHTLICDYCEEEVDETFEEFQDAVNYKKENNWKSIKHVFNNHWSELCPSCQTPEIIATMKGTA